MFKYTSLIVCCLLQHCHGENGFNKMVNVLNWKQLSYDFDGILYTKDTATQKISNDDEPQETVDEKDMFFIQYRNLPGGFAVYKDRVFIGVPRRQYGIPSTLNYVDTSTGSPLLKPYPNVDSVPSFTSVYRPSVDVCQRLWLVDTGLLEVPVVADRIQKKQPEIVIFNLKTNKEILRYQLKNSDLFNGRTSGFTSITVDVTTSACHKAFAYINDLATGGIIVFSLRDRDSWRFSHPSLQYDPDAMNFTIAGEVINWVDGVFSIALTDPDCSGTRTAFYHPLISTEEFSIRTNILKNKNANFDRHYRRVGDRGPLSQSGIHAFHSDSQALVFANVAQGRLVCWNIYKPMTEDNMVMIAQDHKYLLYIADVKIVGKYIWVLVNQMPRYLYSRLNTSEPNYFIHRGNINALLSGSACLW